MTSVKGRLAGQVAVVFGAGSVGEGIGIGRAISVKLAADGARVFATDKDLASAEATARLVREEGGDCTAWQADVCNLASVEEAVAACEAKYGPIDIGVYNVGIQVLGTVQELSEEAWEKTYDVNVKGAFLAVKSLLPRMARHGRGAIVMVSSVASLLSSRTPNIAYGSSKAALNLFARSLAVSHAKDGVRVNVVLPGLIDTPMIRAAITSTGADLAESLAARDRRCPGGRMGSPWDIAAAVAFLASDEAQYISGALLPVDNALTCAMA